MVTSGLSSCGMGPVHYLYTLGDVRVDIPFFIADVLGAPDCHRSKKMRAFDD